MKVLFTKRSRDADKLGTMMKDAQPQPYAYRNHARDDEERALKHFSNDIGMNYDAGFGSLLDDAAAADIERTRRDHRIIEE